MKDLHTLMPYLFIVLLTIFVSRGQAQQLQSQFLMTTHVSDNMLVISLYSLPSNQYWIIIAIKGGLAARIVQRSDSVNSSQIYTRHKIQDWIRNNYRVQLNDMYQETVKLQQVLQVDFKKNIDESVNKLGEGFNYQKLYEETVSLRQQLAQYRQIATDTIALDERNKILQECVINLERELQLLQQENVALRDDNENMRFLIIVGLVGVCLLVVILIPRIWENRRAQWSRL